MAEQDIINQQTDTVIQMPEEDNGQVITPWKAESKSGKFDYQKLIEQFGVEEITDELLNRFEKVTGYKPHLWMRRKLFFAHRHLNEILDDYEKGKQIFLYTGRGPTSASMHLGHSLSFILTSWLQKVFNAVVVIQMADDEKYYFKDITFEETYNLGFENAKDIISFGFNPDKTFIFSNRDYSLTPCYHKVVHDIMKHAKINQIQSLFGLEPSGCVGTMIWPVYQTAAAFSQSFEDIFGTKESYKCLVLHGVDQDVYFRMAREISPDLGFHKPCSIMGKFLPALEGTSKMSSTGTGPVTTIFMTDTEKEVYDKIRKYAFSGGGDTSEKHRKDGCNLTVDIPYQWLKFYMESDNELEHIANEYGSGRMLTGEIKKLLAGLIWEFINKHQKERAKVTPDVVKYFYNIEKFKNQ